MPQPVSLRLSALQLMIVEQRRHQLQQMISRARYALQVAHSLRTVYILAEQVDETGNRRSRCLYVVRDGEQQSFSLLHDALRLRLRFKNALTVAALALYVSEDVHHENRRRENRQQSQHRNSHDHGTSRTDSLAHSRSLLRLEPFAIQFAKYFSFDTLSTITKKIPTEAALCWDFHFIYVFPIFT